jgi:ubiquinone/menaquinone biosynthesis C-methylase UbiE
MMRDQAKDAQNMYDDRSDRYDHSHHPRLARHFVEMAKLQPGEQVLDLACGTGLVSYPASITVGANGSVVGIDISTGMLREANKKLSKHDPKNVTFYQHSITDLNLLEATKGKDFDAIICCSALVLLEDAAGALKHWVTFLKPGGRLITDVTHPLNLAAGTALERVGRRLARPVPYHREPFQTPEDLKSRMEAAGLTNVEMTFLSHEDIPGTDDLRDYIVPDLLKPRIEAEYDLIDADKVFENAINGAAYKGLAEPEDVRTQAKALFLEEWARLADADGKVREVDGLFVGIGWK